MTSPATTVGPRRVKLLKRLGSNIEAGRRGVLDSGSAGELEVERVRGRATWYRRRTVRARRVFWPNGDGFVQRYHQALSPATLFVRSIERADLIDAASIPALTACS